MVVPLKQFGKGQVTLPKQWREKYDTDYFLAEETSQGLLIKPMVDSFYYEQDEDFGISFPTGQAASDVLKKLKQANEKLS